MGGPVAVQRGEDAVVFRQRPEGLLPRLLVRQARRRLHLPDGDRGPELSRGGRAAGRRWPGLPCRAATPRRRGARQEARAACIDVLALAAEIFEADLHRPGRRQGARLSLRPRPRPRRPARCSASAMPRPSASPCATRWRRKGVDVAQMIEAGLLVHGDGIAVPYDRFRDRVMFPIHDRGGQSSPSAAGRSIRAPRRNTSIRRRRQLFHKGALLYNHHRARKAGARARRGDRRSRAMSTSSP